MKPATRFEPAEGPRIIDPNPKDAQLQAHYDHGYIKGQQAQARLTRRELHPTGDLLQPHDGGCRCWPHVSQRDAIEAVIEAATAEYRAAVPLGDPIPTLNDPVPAAVGSEK